MEPKSAPLSVAAKSLRKEALDTERDELLEEALVMAQMDHPNVVRLLGVVTRGRPLYVVLGKSMLPCRCAVGCNWLVSIEHMRNGDLKGYLESKTYTPEQQVQWCAQAAAGLGHIAALGFIHRDVAVRHLACISHHCIWR